MIHELKTWPEYFEAILLGVKQFELRKNDRDFQVFDSLLLREWSPETKQYTGRVCTALVTYMVQGAFGLPEDMCVMSIRVTSVVTG